MSLRNVKTGCALSALGFVFLCNESQFGRAIVIFYGLNEVKRKE